MENTNTFLLSQQVLLGNIQDTDKNPGFCSVNHSLLAWPADLGVSFLVWVSETKLTARRRAASSWSFDQGHSATTALAWPVCNKGQVCKYLVKLANLQSSLSHSYGWYAISVAGLILCHLYLSLAPFVYLPSPHPNSQPHKVVMVMTTILMVTLESDSGDCLPWR